MEIIKIFAYCVAIEAIYCGLTVASLLKERLPEEAITSNITDTYK